MFLTDELIHRTKRRITTAPYSTERRIQQRDRTLNTTKQDNYQNRTRKRPCRFLFLFFI